MINKDSDKIIEKGRLLEETCSTRGWQEVIEPILKSRILEIIGGYSDGKYIRGKIESFKELNEVNFAMGIKEGLIDFHNSIAGLILNGRNASQKLKKAKVPKVIKNKYGQENNFKNLA